MGDTQECAFKIGNIFSTVFLAAQDLIEAGHFFSFGGFDGSRVSPCGPYWLVGIWASPDIQVCGNTGKVIQYF